MEESQEQQLGGNIVLSGFKIFDGGTMVVLKKIIGNYARRFSTVQGFERLHVNVKAIHEVENSKKFEINAKLMHKGQTAAAETTEHNIFVGVDAVLKKIENGISK